MTATATAGITIDNIGPIKHLEMDAAPGTITVLRGPNGEGKTTALEAIDAITRGGGRLESRDGTTGGRAEAWGVTIKVGRGGANRRMGDLAVTAVEDHLSIAEFVDPRLKDPVAADGRRLKALVSLAGVEANPTVYHDLAGGPEAFAEIVNPATLEVTDPIVLAERIKRDLETASRTWNQRAERLFGEIKAKHAANEGLDLEAEHEAGVLQRRHEMALSMAAALDERVKACRVQGQQRLDAQAALDQARASYTGPTVEQAQEHLAGATLTRDGAAEAVKTQEATVELLRRQLHAAELTLRERQTDLAQRQAELSRASDGVTAARQHIETVDRWQKALDATTAAANPPTTEELQQAAGDLKVARIAMETGVLIRAALQRQQEAVQIEAQRKAAVTRSEKLRDAAQCVLDVLAEQVKGLVPGLKLDTELRIVVPHPKRTECFYADLSHGERWKMALDIAVAAFQRRGQRGVLAIPQEAWEGLDGRNRKLIAEHVATLDLIVITAEAERSVDVAKGLEVEVIDARAKAAPVSTLQDSQGSGPAGSERQPVPLPAV
jgi:energy-coupling factor transporter ATP-binding protein EcfA2